MTASQPPDLRSLLDAGQRDPGVVLLTVPTVLTLWVYGGKQAAFRRLFPAASLGPNGAVYATLYEYLAAFALMFAVPVLIGALALKRAPRRYGLRRGDLRHGLTLAAVGLPVALLAAYLGTGDPAMRAAYPLAGRAMRRLPVFLLVEGAYLLYYLGWEFLFRGFMLFGLERACGPLLALLIQTIPSTLVHIGKPFSENVAALVAGPILGYVALRTRSILAPLLLHAAVGIATDALLTLRVP